MYVSALPESPLAVMAKEEGFTYLPMAQCLAGGVSALNAGTLLVLAAAGIDPLYWKARRRAFRSMICGRLKIRCGCMQAPDML